MARFPPPPRTALPSLLRFASCFLRLPPFLGAQAGRGGRGRGMVLPAWMTQGKAQPIAGALGADKAVAAGVALQEQRAPGGLQDAALSRSRFSQQAPPVALTKPPPGAPPSAPPGGPGAGSPRSAPPGGPPRGVPPGAPPRGAPPGPPPRGAPPARAPGRAGLGFSPPPGATPTPRAATSFSPSSTSGQQAQDQPQPQAQAQTPQPSRQHQPSPRQKLCRGSQISQKYLRLQ